MWKAFLVMLLAVAADQGTKWLVMANMQLHESISVIPGVFRLTYIRNPGAALGMLENSRWVFLVASILGIAAVIFYLVKCKPSEWMVWLPLSFIAGGGLGNMVDRLFYGESFGNGTVVDFIDFCAFPRLWKWIFNVADIFVCVGAGILFLYLLLDIIKEYKAEKAKKEQENHDKNA